MKNKLSSNTYSISLWGTGSSSGVPSIGCLCSTCSSENPFNKRTRSSALFNFQEKNLLVDATPDFRSQFLRAGITEIDALFLTHSHEDHVGGLGELRALYFSQKRPVDLFLSKSCLDELKQRFSYIFGATPAFMWEEVFRIHILDLEKGYFDWQGERFFFFPYAQNGMEVLGIRHRSVAYITDIKEYTPALIPFLQNIEILIISALRKTPSLYNLTLSEAINIAQKAGSKTTFLTHLSHEVEHEETSATLPSSVYLSYDGLTLDY